MNARRVIVVAALASLTTAGLSACTPGLPVAYHVDDDVVDIAFCESFEAASVTIAFSMYPPPGQGPMYSIEVRTGFGAASSFGDGVPVSTSTSGWTFEKLGPAPDGWERVDYAFYGERGEYVAGEFLFSRDVKSSDWAWTEGLDITAPECDMNLK